MSVLVPILLFAATSTATPHLKVSVELEPVILDYELPGHPNILGRGHVGAIGRAAAEWVANPHVTIRAGVVGRLPFALDLERDTNALPIFAIDARPFGDNLLMRFGSLDFRHGYHPAIVDESRFAYGRNVVETYNRFLVPEAVREFGQDPYLPAEHGAQLIARAGIARAEVFLDWQLLETDEHREKFNFGMLGSIESRWVDLDMQFRLTHYGGQLFTKGDPVRNAGLDNVRQPETMGLTLTFHPLVVGDGKVDVFGTFVGGHMLQEIGGEERWHHGFEVGTDVTIWDAFRVGYRIWLPKDDRPGFVSEDSDPLYSQDSTHRVTLGLLQKFGGLEIDGRLDLAVAHARTERIQYLAVTRIVYRFERILLSLDD